MKEDCIFCKIANGLIPARKLYEDDDFCVILDLVRNCGSKGTSTGWEDRVSLEKRLRVSGV